MKKVIKTILYFCMMGTAMLASATDTEWTWLHQKIFSSEELSANNKPAMTLAKDNLPFFNQLILSWNALRPAQGFFAFWVQTRDQATQQWSEWHKMMEWGADVQRSFNSNQGNTHYAHVRLETGNRHADGFRIKAIAHKGASLAAFKAMFVALSDLSKFTEETMSKHGLKVPSVMIAQVPKKSQMVLDHKRSGHMCSPTSCSMLVSYLLGKDIDPLQFAHNSFDSGLDAYGSWPFNIAHAFECCGGDILFATARLPSFLVLYQRLQKGIPVVVSVRGFLAGAPKVYERGHLLMVVGFDAKKQMVICHDPALSSDEAIVQAYPLQSFLRAWERSNRLAYLAHPLAVVS